MAGFPKQIWVLEPKIIQQLRYSLKGKTQHLVHS